MTVKYRQLQREEAVGTVLGEGPMGRAAAEQERAAPGRELHVT